jgi:hypothetical protein
MKRIKRLWTTALVFLILFTIATVGVQFIPMFMGG